MVSVIVPTYNSEKTIVKAIESIIFQTYNDWEIIIVDDGSKDRTIEIIQNFIESLSSDIRNKILFYKQANSGPSTARNKGVELSKGEFISFLDSDDEWSTPNKLKIQMKYFSDFPDLALCGGGHDINRISDKSIEFKIITFNKLLPKNYFATPSVVIKRKIFEEFKFDVTKKYSEDFKLWLQISHKYKCIYINTVLSNNQERKRRYGASGLSRNLFAMEKGELSTYYSLYSDNLMGLGKFIVVCSFSLFKFGVRLVRNGIHNLK